MGSCCLTGCGCEWHIPITTTAWSGEERRTPPKNRGKKGSGQMEEPGSDCAVPEAGPPMAFYPSTSVTHVTNLRGKACMLLLSPSCPRPIWDCASALCKSQCSQDSQAQVPAPDTMRLLNSSHSETNSQKPSHKPTREPSSCTAFVLETTQDSANLLECLGEAPLRTPCLAQSGPYTQGSNCLCLASTSNRGNKTKAETHDVAMLR